MRLSKVEFDNILDLVAREMGTKARKQVLGWVERGDGCAIYSNVDLGSRGVGQQIYVSYGGKYAQLEGDEPPKVLPDIGSQINWMYHLKSFYREGGETSAD